MEEPLFSWVMLVGRVCLALVYLVSGVHKAIWFDKALIEFRDARAPFVRASVIGTVVVHTVASLCIIGGIFVRESSLALALFTALATWRVHAFWHMAGDERLTQSRFALAHLAVIGGLLLLAAVGPGTIVLSG